MCQHFDDGEVLLGEHSEDESGQQVDVLCQKGFVLLEECLCYGNGTVNCSMAYLLAALVSGVSMFLMTKGS